MPAWRFLSVLSFVGLLARAGASAASPGTTEVTLPAPAVLGWVGLDAVRPTTVLQVIPALAATARHQGTPVAPRATGRRTLIYLNRRGVTVVPGANDARLDRSTIPARATQVSPFEGTAVEWDEIVTCVSQMFERFDVEITDVNPGDVSHVEAVIGGSVEQLASAVVTGNVLGISPFTADCQPIPNAMVFVLSREIRDQAPTAPDLAETICEVAAQEIGHAFGLDHQYLAADPMSYLPFEGLRQFQDVSAPCGEFSERACGLPGGARICSQQQNSFALLIERVGPAGSSRDDFDGDGVSDTIHGGCQAGPTGTAASGWALCAAVALARRRRRR